MRALRTARATAGSTSVASGTLTIGAGLVLLGLSATVYLVLSARAVGPREFASVSTLWTLVYTFGIGAFLPFEQELGRALAHRTELGQGGRPVVIRTAQAAAVTLTVLLVAGAALAPQLVDRLFDGHWALLIALAVAVAAMAAQYVTRGAFAGSGRFAWYSAQLGIEGGLRIAGCAVLFLLGTETIGPYAWILAIAPLTSVLLTAPGTRRGLRPGPAAAWEEVSVNLGWLLAAAICAQGVANAAMVAMKLLDPDGDAAGQFLAAFVVARVPLFLFQAVQAALLPGLARALAAGDRQGFHRELRHVLTATGAVAGAGVLGSAVLGPQVLGLAFGSEFSLGRLDIVVLAAATGLYMVAQVFQSGLVALKRHRDNAIGWSSSLAVFVLACLVPVSALHRVELALVLSCVVAAGYMSARLFTASNVPDGVTS
ncbi:lipopolysaccharide biosynthesis protein [Actinomadura barringtoniae]|uniref:Lipopolysaccharide biosynthesis protein n=1 Tax=Actinomadura barringtoniae TaxID=1427535 RepID=A0A939P9T5_9ACTN|nr:lipopolysaccharide biosynthesis protein [Actinomadura barringtoniae]MBO2448468.1 lipopolysaccharide biosynthesis protein [Actinomadura barringtoniae]